MPYISFFKKKNQFIYFNWRLITLQCCSVFWHTLTCISHGCTCVPHLEPPSHLPPHPISQGHPSAPALSSLPYISFSCLIVWFLKASSTMLNRNDESGHLPLVHDLREKAFTLSPLNIVLAMGLSNMTCIIMRHVPSISTLLSVIPWMDVEFFQMHFSTSVEVIMWCLLFFCWCGVAHGLICGYWTILDSWNTSHLTMIF